MVSSFAGLSIVKVWGTPSKLQCFVLKKVLMLVGMVKSCVTLASQKNRASNQSLLIFYPKVPHKLERPPSWLPSQFSPPSCKLLRDKRQRNKLNAKNHHILSAQSRGLWDSEELIESGAHF